MNELKTKIDLAPLTDETIQTESIAMADLWLVRTQGGDSFGPYETKSLKDYSQKYDFLFEGAAICNLAENTWKEMYKSPLFQRRKPQLVSAQNLLHNQEFYINIQGQKKGPYLQEDIKGLLDKGTITPRSEMSLDGGSSWIKVYEYHIFDRRTKKATNDLPHAVKIKTEKKPYGASDTPDPIIELSLEPGSFKRTPKRAAKKIKVEQKTKTKNQSKYKLYVSVAAMLILTFVVTKNSPEQPNTTIVTGTAYTETKGIDNSERNSKFKNTKRMPASIDKTEIKVKSHPKVIKRKVIPRYKKPVVKKISHDMYKEEIYDEDKSKTSVDNEEIQEDLSRALANEDEEVLAEEFIQNSDSLEEIEELQNEEYAEEF